LDKSIVQYFRTNSSRRDVVECIRRVARAQFTSQVTGFRLAAKVCGLFFDSLYTTRNSDMGIGLSIRRTCSRSIAVASGHQATKGKDAASHSPYRRTKVLNPRGNNDLRGVLGAENQYLSTIDTAGHKGDDSVKEFG
jgi:hypothetical protein